MEQRVAVAMSGGVDSSAAAWLLKSGGLDCVGLTGRMFCRTLRRTFGDRTACPGGTRGQCRSAFRWGAFPP